MKKSIVLLTILLTSCTPQVTVTSEVAVTSTPVPTQIPIPTPTLHPNFVNVQEQIAASGGRFMLTADGAIQDNGVPINGLSIAPDGTMTITVDDEEMALDPADVDFDDEKGIAIKGYKQDTDGKWVEANSAEDMATAILDQYSVDPESVTITEADGVTRVTDNETGNVLFETDGEVSKFSLGFAVDTIAAASCEPTEFKPNSYGLRSGNSVEEREKFNKYSDLVANNSGLPGWTGMSTQYFLIDRAEQCWGWFYATDQNDENKDKVIIYRDVEGVVQVVPILDEITWDELYSFAGDK
ncbi:hypothetical protein MASR2M66_21960 [Chloroflexota bacterium]